jgi:hypothetical protein
MNDPPPTKWLSGNLAEETPNVEILHSVLPVHEMQCCALTQRHAKESLGIQSGPARIPLEEVFAV